MLVRSCLNSCMLIFSILKTNNFQLSKLGLEKEEELDSKLSTSAGLQREQANFRKKKKKIYVSLTTLKTLTMWIMTNCGKLWEKWEYQTILPVSWETCLGQEATAKTLKGTPYWFKIKKGVQQGCLLSTCLFNFYAEHIMRNARLDELQAGIKIGRKNVNSSDRWVIPL